MPTRWPGPTKCGPRHPFEIVNALTLIKSEINNYRPTQYWWAEGLKQLEFQLELVSKVCSVIPTLSYEYYKVKFPRSVAPLSPLPLTFGVIGVVDAPNRVP